VITNAGTLPACPTCQHVPNGFTADFAADPEPPHDRIDPIRTTGHVEAVTVTLTPCGHEHRDAAARDLYRQILTLQEAP
jgi:hypothetical protein